MSFCISEKVVKGYWVMARSSEVFQGLEPAEEGDVEQEQERLESWDFGILMNWKWFFKVYLRVLALL